MVITILRNGESSVYPAPDNALHHVAALFSPLQSTSMAVDSGSNQCVALGLAIPPFTAHAISVSLPTWRDNVDYEEGKRRVVDAMASGYPRFFIHPKVQKVSSGPRCHVNIPHYFL